MDSSRVFRLCKTTKEQPAMMMKSERAKGDLAKEQGAREEYHQRKNILWDECPTGGRAEGADRPLQKNRSAANSFCDEAKRAGRAARKICCA